MDILRVLTVLRKRKRIVAFGAIAGLIAAFLSVYSIKESGGQLVIEQRRQAEYETTFKLILDEPGFGIGRAEREGASAHWARVERDKDLALVYSSLLMSDEFIDTAIPELKTNGARMKASSPDKLPMIWVTVTGKDPEVAKSLARKASLGFVSYIKSQQKSNKVAPRDRIEVRTISSPNEPTVLPTHDQTLAVAMFSLFLLSSLYLALAVENVAERASCGKSVGITELIPRESKG